MIETSLWKTLDDIQKQKTETLINTEWVSLQKSVRQSLIEAAEHGDRKVQLTIIYQDNAERLAEIIRGVSGFTCDLLATQTNGYRVTISF